MYKIWDKVVILSLNEKDWEENFRYYSIIDWVQVKDDWDIYTVWGKKVNPDITVLATDDEIKQFYN
jgi:hypothetical protein